MLAASGNCNKQIRPLSVIASALRCVQLRLFCFAPSGRVCSHRVCEGQFCCEVLVIAFDCSTCLPSIEFQDIVADVGAERGQSFGTSSSTETYMVVMHMSVPCLPDNMFVKMIYQYIYISLFRRSGLGFIPNGPRIDHKATRFLMWC